MRRFIVVHHHGFTASAMTFLTDLVPISLYILLNGGNARVRGAGFW
jgi:hypothetical protein